MYHVFDYFDRHQAEWLGRQIVFGLAGGDTTIPYPQPLLGVAQANTPDCGNNWSTTFKPGPSPPASTVVWKHPFSSLFFEGWIAPKLSLML